MRQIILASASPRRRELLRRIFPRFDVVVSGAEERAQAGVSPQETAYSLARLKCESVAQRYPRALVIGCDTVVAVDGQMLGKPASGQEAFEMLRLLSGREHLVHTGVFVCEEGNGEGFCETSVVRFLPMSDSEIWEYVATGEPMDKAGAYGIQGLGGRYAKLSQGDFDNVVGLPVTRLQGFLEEKYHHVLL